jgi:energy-coupling factor transporter transmembrane protein EcfT
MKKLIHTAAARGASLLRPIITLGIGLLLALFSAALTYSTPPAMDGRFGAGAFFITQPASPPQQKDLSEIGSTDGIVIMGFLIVLIIIIPILLRRKSWMEPR